MQLFDVFLHSYTFGRFNYFYPMKKIYFIGLTALLFSLNIQAQPHCAFDDVRNTLRLQDPDYEQSVQAAYRQFEDIRAQGLLDINQNASRAVRTIPVAVHVVLPSNLQSQVPDTKIQQMIDFMTQDFRLLNPSYSQTRQAVKNVAADTEIEFCLAKTDANGQPTTGITRKNVTVSCYSTGSDANDMKRTQTGGVNGWNPQKYLNIWIVDICGSGNLQTAGYAYLPTYGLVGSSNDGIVLDYQIGIGANNRSASHEAGHYLGLLHAWGELSSNACGNVFPDTDDGFSDTPDSKGPNFPCQSVVSCSNNSSYGDMYENIMDYSSCPRLFTQQQSNFMNLVLNGGPFNTAPFNSYGFASRASLVTNNTACNASNIPAADFTANRTSICVGEQVTFTNQTSGPGTITYSWSFQGGNPSTSTAANPTVTYPTAGTYSVTLTATNSSGSGQKVKTGYINVQSAKTLPLVEGFQNTTFPPADWAIENSDGATTWARSSSAGGYGQSTASAYMNFFTYNSGSQRDWLTSPVYNLSGVSNAQIKFDYAYRRFSTTSNSDSLQIMYSIDCGNTWTQVWKRGGASLQTVSTTSTANFVPTAAQWKTDSIALPAGVLGKNNVRFAFVGINGNGNNLYIDNINIYNVTPPTPQAPVADFVGTPTTVVVGNSVAFTDLSTNTPTSWAWSFAGGTPATSTTQNPTITYNTVGQYNVTLTATNTIGSSAPVTKTAYITVINAPQGNACDTLDNTSNDTTGVIYRYPDGTGFLAGNNSEGDMAKAERFENSSAVTVRGAFIGVYAKSAAPGSKTVTFALWDDSGNAGAPGTTPLDTKTVPLSQILSPTGQMIYVAFNSNPVVSGNFYVGVILPTTAGDSLSLFTTEQSAAYANAPYAWEQYSDGSWHSYASYYGYYYGASVSHWVFPEVCDVAPAALPEAKFTANKTSICAGEQVSFTDNSSGNPTSWSWNFGAGASPQTATTKNPTVTFNGAGTYTVKLTVSNASGSDDTTISNYITVNAKPTANTTSIAVSCFGMQNGSAKVTASSNAPFTYLWSNNGGTADSIVNKGAGTYTVTVTNSKNCTVTASVQITQPQSALTASLNATDALCTQNNGTVTTTASGGNGNYTYSWSNNSTGASINALSPNTYSVTITDAKSCSVVKSVTVGRQQQSFNIALNTTASSCGMANGEVSVVTDASYASYVWNDNSTDDKLENVGAGTYSVTVTNVSGCTSTATAVVADAGNFSVAVSSKANPSIAGASDGFIVVSANGGTPPITYQWNTNATGETLSEVSAGVYTVTATDANGCKSILVDSLIDPMETAIRNIQSETSVLVYPNPSKDMIHVVVNTSAALNGKIVIENMLGQSVIFAEMSARLSKLAIDISILPSGIYYLTYQSAFARKTISFIKK